MSEISKVSRRDFVKVGGLAGAGLVLGVRFPQDRPWTRATSLSPNAFVEIDTSGTVSIWVSQSEMGQGVFTSLPMLLAEELEADWESVKVLQAPAHPDKYGSQMTGGSSAVRGRWESLRKAGATAREMLRRAAADAWGVPVEECEAQQGSITHGPSGRQAGYGELAAQAADLPVPEDPPLKADGDWTFLGKPMPRVDSPAKVDGSAVYGIDVRVPDMLFATVVRPPTYGGSLESFDDGAARAVTGVVDVFTVSAGVAVVARSTWAAFKGAEALDVTWDEGSFDMDTQRIRERFREQGESEGVAAREEGDVSAALAAADTTLEAVYEVPYLAHAAMEPMNATAHVTADGCRIWAPTQDPQSAQQVAAEITGLPVERVQVEVTFLGGGFGRRAEQDFVRDAVEASQKAGAPVQVTWTREETTRHDFFRPATWNRLTAALGPGGLPVAWQHRIVGPSIMERFFGQAPPNDLDFASVEGAANLPYHVPNIHVDYVKENIGVPVGWWRSVGSSQNAFVTESFIDELAHAAGADPFEYRRELLAQHPRHRGVLELAAEKAGWGTPPPEGRARGIAVAESFGSFVAEVAEVSVERNGVRVHRVVCAVDCGRTVNPDTIEAQMESGIVYGLTAALWGEITIDRGRAVQANFDEYRPLRMREMPAVDVYIVESTQPPGGVGEPGTPPIAPAVTNALFALTGVRIRRLPIEGEEGMALSSGSGRG
ncbi:MAG: xanthine dehydrogenase family protein molybdopterin-binding subunit [Gemmatimonadota bacterium]|nr:xanthine dehydrogenase family protein molybdopterin-binding subunit [Gemmatimonadota bacterium]